TAAGREHVTHQRLAGALVADVAPFGRRQRGGVRVGQFAAIRAASPVGSAAAPRGAAAARTAARVDALMVHAGARGRRARGHAGDVADDGWLEQDGGGACLSATSDRLEKAVAVDVARAGRAAGPAVDAGALVGDLHAGAVGYTAVGVGDAVGASHGVVQRYAATGRGSALPACASRRRRAARRPRAVPARSSQVLAVDGPAARRERDRQTDRPETTKRARLNAWSR